MDERFLRDIEILIDMFRAGDWDEVCMTSADVAVLLSTSSGGSIVKQGGSDASAAERDNSSNEPQPIVPAAADKPMKVGAVDPSWVAVRAPNLGTFYRAPKPGSPPFVEVGDTVESGTELCLVEVMKLFTSVQSEQKGVVKAVVAKDAELVETDQPLMYIKPD